MAVPVAPIYFSTSSRHLLRRNTRQDSSSASPKLQTQRLLSRIHAIPPVVSELSRYCQCQVFVNGIVVYGPCSNTELGHHKGEQSGCRQLITAGNASHFSDIRTTQSIAIDLKTYCSTGSTESTSTKQGFPRIWPDYPIGHQSVAALKLLDCCFGHRSKVSVCCYP